MPKGDAKMETTVFYTPAQVAKCLGCSIPYARAIFHRSDFPAQKIGKNWKVEKSAFEDWCRTRHEVSLSR